MDSVATSALHTRASSIAVRSARCDSGESFKATTILVNIKATRAEPTSALSYRPNSNSLYYMFLVGDRAVLALFFLPKSVAQSAQYVIQPFYNRSEVTSADGHDPFSCW